jgi:hypothetical protein
MNGTPIEVTGILYPDGTMVLDRKPDLPPGKVSVTLRAQAESAPPKEDWWHLMQRIRAQREAAGYNFLNESQMAERLDELREEDDRIDRIRDEIEEERRKQEPS